MASTVNAQSSGYEKLDTLKTLHSTVLKELRKEITDTRNLIGENNGFYVEDTCKKIITLLDTMDNQIITTLEQSFSVSEKSVTSMENVVTQNDHF